MDPRRRIPSVEALLASAPFDRLQQETGRGRVAAVLRTVQAEVRDRLAAGGDPERVDDPGWYAERVRDRLAAAAVRSLREVINATGVVLHTNLGRAPLADAARRAMVEAAGYAALEYDLDTGRRGSRDEHCTGLLCELTGAEAALVVNNNAAAVVLALNTLAHGRGAVISRGELVEIGGSFRVPEIMARSGARMVEVGSTNRTHLRDYRAALDGGDVALILKVHRSNFRVEGFTAEVDAAGLADLGRGAEVPLVHDLGSGALVDLTAMGLPPEPTAGQALAAGADVVSMSGDKLLGGPQAGILLGRRDLLRRMRSNPFCRAMRCDKVTLAALEATLALYRDGAAPSDVPVLRMLAADPATLRDRAADLAARITAAGLPAEAVDAAAAVGGGAYPGVELPGAAVAISDPDGVEALARRLRQGTPPVVGQIQGGRLLLHTRTLAVEQESTLLDRLMAAAGQEGEADAQGAGGDGPASGRRGAG